MDKISVVRQFTSLFLFITFCFFQIPAQAGTTSDLKKLQAAYPDYVNSVSSTYVAWKDGTRMAIESSPLVDWFTNRFMHLDKSVGVISRRDIAHDRYEPFFKKMYGGTADAVKQNLVTIYWMPHVFGKRYPLRVTRVNDIDKKLQRISAELEKLPRADFKYLERPAGAFYWRNVDMEDYLSAHSFGIAVDINSQHSDYWLWDLRRAGKSISEVEYHNHVPMEIVKIFEKEGFFWGGNWYFYDTMHFEYRPDLLI